MIREACRTLSLQNGGGRIPFGAGGRPLVTIDTKGLLFRVGTLIRQKDNVIVGHNSVSSCHHPIASFLPLINFW